MFDLSSQSAVLPEETLGDIEDEMFRRYGYHIIDWTVQYLQTLRDYPVLSQVAPGEIRRQLPAHPPVWAEPLEDILTDFKQIILPGITHWNAPGFLAYFATNSSGPSLLGEMLANALNANPMLWHTSPAATELEQVTLDWVCQLLGLPPLFGVMFDSSSGAGIISALVAAREALPDLSIRQYGLAGRAEVPRLRLYISEETHMSVERAAIALGIGLQGVRKIPTDAAFRMDVAALKQVIQQDRADGWLPLAVVATIGTTSSSSIDPVADIADVCEHYHLWLHVDAAYGGAAAVDPDHRWVLAGCERADSLILNPYKWLFTGLDGSIFYTRRPEIVKRAFSLTPEYLSNAGEGKSADGVPNMADYGLPLGHRFRALKLWMVLRAFGQEGLAARIHEHCRLAGLLAQYIDDDPNFERLAPTPLSLVCFRAHPFDMQNEIDLERLNQHLLTILNAQGHFYLSHTRLKRIFTLRAAITSLRTAEQDIHALWQALHTCLAQARTELAHEEKSC